MIIILKHTNTAHKAQYKVHYIRHSKLVKSTETMTEKQFNSIKEMLLKNCKEVTMLNVKNVNDLNFLYLVN